MVFGLPLHPLVVHFAVVLIPLGAMALLVVYFVPRWRARYLPLATALTVAGALAAVAAKFTGEAFAGQVGLPTAHQRWGNLATITTLLLGAAATVWTLQLRRTTVGEQASGNSPPQQSRRTGDRAACRCRNPARDPDGSLRSTIRLGGNRWCRDTFRQQPSLSSNAKPLPHQRARDLDFHTRTVGFAHAI